MATIVSLQEVTKDYGQGQALTHALRGVNLVIEAGEFTAMAGPSGSGKSTLLNIIGGLDRPTSGRVEVDGREISGLSNTELGLLRRDRLGFIFQSYNLIPVLTALENAEYVLMLQGIPSAERRARVRKVLVAIARAIVSEPALVLADEPTANVDSKTGMALLDLMHRLNEEKGVTFFFSTHEQPVMKRARRLLQLEDGVILNDGTAGELVEAE
jgi:putative ABC transport system ATP-binding protein